MNIFKRILTIGIAALLMVTAGGCIAENAELQTTPEVTLTPEPTPEPTPEHFLLTFAGDCTLGGAESHFNIQLGFVNTVGENYAYPFANTIEYFANDDFSMVNLEGVLADQSTAVVKKHVFRGPTHLVNVLTENSIEAVTIANNHTLDHGQAGYDSTTATLTNAGVPYVEQDKTLVVTTESGLTIGIYAVTLTNLNADEITAAISALDSDERIDVVILAAHWGIENTFRPNEQQQTIAHAAIDAGADIVYGTHPHVLQTIEAYNGGIIYYSLGNFAFGGNAGPKDYDTAIVQQEVIRSPDGTVTLGELTVIPCSVSSDPHQNNFRPTPYEPSSDEFLRTISKLDGTYAGGNLPWD